MVVGRGLRPALVARVVRARDQEAVVRQRGQVLSEAPLGVDVPDEDVQDDAGDKGEEEGPFDDVAGLLGDGLVIGVRV